MVEITIIIDAVQRSVLDEILTQNSQIEYLNPYLNHFFNNHFRITSKKIKESTVNEYLIVFVFHRQSRKITIIIDVVQQSVLDEILTQNSQIEYLSDCLTFKFNIWIVTYKDLHVKI
ncbi:hypothetical protein H5410_062621 [Solanum commersonii]|uniref:Uncharacterized protein n=1 Tax=Solanum commersonii TaxID=4109 RepID=A0A9J5WC08_SOLCO|nr:hypothetical protein H5410_062621 [Solanum commersonii]